MSAPEPGERLGRFDPPPPHPPVLVVNAGSSSLKLKLLPAGLGLTVERIGGASQIRFGAAPVRSQPVTDHRSALELGLGLLAASEPAGGSTPLAAVGHRVVHGGERYSQPQLVDQQLLEALDDLGALAPLHNPANLQGIRAARRLLPEVPQVVVFDTAFHATLPARAFLYGMPRRFHREQAIRKYGFHGTSHDYVTRRAAERLGRPRDALRIVSLHLGNGASAAAVQAGRSIDTSMGFTPLDGLLMGTRCGELDPGVVLFLLRQGVGVDALDTLLNREAGLRGLSGVSNDIRDVRAAAAGGNEDARDALAVFGYRLRKIIGAYAAAMGGLDAVVFTGGIGENDAATRADATCDLGFLGIVLDAERNSAHETFIQANDSRVALLVVPTDEEAMIASATLDALALAANATSAAAGAGRSRSRRDIHEENT